MPIDTNAVLAILNQKDINHKQMLALSNAPFIVLMTILAEVDYLATKYIGAHAAQAFIASEAFHKSFHYAKLSCRTYQRCTYFYSHSSEV